MRDLNTSGEIRQYPGSPWLARKLMREGDTLVACELHPEDYRGLSQLFRSDEQAKILELDGWTALKSLLPPKERRGVILVDPPFEEPGEFDRMSRGLNEIHRRFATGSAILWYPIKDPRAIRSFHAGIIKLGVPKVMALDCFVRAPSDPEVLNGTGLIILNPPFVLEEQLGRLLPYLRECLGQGAGAIFRIERLSGDHLNSS